VEAQTQALYSGDSEERLQREGAMLTGLVAAREGTLYGDAVFALSIPNTAVLPYHRRGGQKLRSH